jgi:type IV pilus assembly protein PilY1
VTLWEYTNDNMGYTYGNPVITKLSNGQWVVLLASGYNNVPDGTLKPDGTAYGGDGVGRLFVLDAGTGALIRTISTGAGTPTSPSGLARISAWVNNATTDNTALRAYGGDMLGNVWRVDLTSLSATTGSADVVKLATLLDPDGNPQPITTTPQLMNVGAASTRMVYIGTGRYLGEADLTDTPAPQVETVWGLAEDLTLHSTSAAYIANGNSVLPTAPLTLRHQLNKITLSAVSGHPEQRQAASPICSATGADVANGAGCVGWYADLPATGERVNLDMRLALGSLTVITNVPLLASCDSGGSSWRNVFDATTGGAVTGSDGIIGTHVTGALSVGTSLIRDQFGRILSIITKSDGSQEVSVVPTQQAAPLGRRSSWRDLLN